MPSITPESVRPPTHRLVRGGIVERLLDPGAGAVTRVELLAVLLAPRPSGPAPLPLAEARSLLARASGRLARIPGLIRQIDPTASRTARHARLRVLAGIELGHRASQEALPDPTHVRGPADVHALLSARLRSLDHEEFHVILLNTRHRVLGVRIVSRGILDASLVHPREVFRPALEAGAGAVILVHNHPSGDPTPSPEDRQVTRRMTEAGELLGLRVLDHVVIGDGRWARARP